MSAACYLTHFVDQNINCKGKLSVVKKDNGNSDMLHDKDGGRCITSREVLGGVV